jgi:glycosyltransferase involved in cell wall biosynthesis
VAALPDVAIITPYPRVGVRHGGDSGVASYSANLAHALTEIGVEPMVIAPHHDGEPAIGDDGGVAVHRVFTSGRADAVPSALAAARAAGARVAHLQHELFLYGGPASIAGLVAGLGRRAGVPTVLTLHQVVDPADVTPQFTRMHRIGVPAVVARNGLRALQHGLPRMADATIVHEPAFARIVPRARAVPHGIETAEPADAVERAAARVRLGLPADRLVALCFGFIAPYKGLETALDAAVLAGDDLHLVVAGGPHPRLAARNDDYAGRLRTRYEDTARFTGYVPDGDVATWFRAADVALFPYPAPHAASGALALALAHSTAVLLSPRLASSCGADPMLSCPGDPVALAARLRELARDPRRLADLRTAADQLARERSWRAAALAHQTIYEEVAHAPSTDRRRLRAA